jgi:hypothetical protein
VGLPFAGDETREKRAKKHGKVLFLAQKWPKKAQKQPFAVTDQLIGIFYKLLILLYLQ